MTDVLIASALFAQLAPGQWSTERAWEWHEAQPTLIGFNFVPSTACNDIEFWQAETFDRETIDRELGWAEDTGFNTCRVFINFVVWEADREGLLERFEEFLSIAKAHGISVMPVLFDDCNFAGIEPKAGPQPEPTPGMSNACWVPSPSAAMVVDPTSWGPLEAYVKDVIGAHVDDERIVVWDLYNEPGNSGPGDGSLPLVEAAFGWAREAGASQPLTIGVWGASAELSQRQIDLSDVVSFHRYAGLQGLRDGVAHFKQFGRPVICTEWMARTLGARWETDLPMLVAEGVGSYNWGLVNGRTQTQFPWGSPADGPEPAVWFHDLFHADGTPYDEREIQAIGIATGELSGAFAPYEHLVEPSSNTGAEWRYTFEAPADGWESADFDDSAWQEGPGPFGSHEPQIGRVPGTSWATPDIWLRRTFELAAAKVDDAKLLVHHDDSYEVYLNGVLAAEATGYVAHYQRATIAEAALASLSVGENTLAFHCHQDWGGQFIDIGIVTGGDYVE